jgi:hypothetical protein
MDRCERCAGSDYPRKRRSVYETTLWLLESVSTAFQGLDTGPGAIQGKYFNRIAKDLRKRAQTEHIAYHAKAERTTRKRAS